jgi:hypothetical protein
MTWSVSEKCRNFPVWLESVGGQCQNCLKRLLRYHDLVPSRLAIPFRTLLFYYSSDNQIQSIYNSGLAKHLVQKNSFRRIKFRVLYITHTKEYNICQLKIYFSYIYKYIHKN